MRCCVREERSGLGTARESHRPHAEIRAEPGSWSAGADRRESSVSIAGLGFEPRHAGSEPTRADAAPQEVASEKCDQSVTMGPEALARALLLQASTAPDPAPLIAAAEALLAQAKPPNVTKLKRRQGGAS